MKDKVKSIPKAGAPSLCEEFKVYSDVRYLPLLRYPSYLSEGFVGICTGGTAVLEVFSNRCRVSENDLVVVIPHMFAVMAERSDDFSMLFFRIDYRMFADVMSGICHLTLDFFFYMRTHYVFTLAETECERFNSFIRMLMHKAERMPVMFRRESVILLLRVFFWDIFVQFRRDTDKGSVRYTHKEELAFRFFNLVTEHYSTNRDVSFYAGLLCISPKYLTMVMRDVTGRSAKDWIVEHTLLEIKSLLRDASLDIKDVVRITKFPNQSLLSRFFRKHTGMSPSQYRERTHM